MLTKQERRALEQIERELHLSDPRLVMVMSGGASYRSRRRAESRRRAMLVLVDLLAIAMIVLAAATGELMLIFCSALVTVAAIGMHAVRRRARPA